LKPGFCKTASYYVPNYPDSVGSVLLNAVKLRRKLPLLLERVGVRRIKK